MSKNIYVLIGPSGSGKNSLGLTLEEHGFIRLITSTTRKKRMGEEEGVSYYFLTPEAFKNMEKIEETYYAGNFYGLSKQEVDQKLCCEKPIYIIMDQPGYKRLKAIYGDQVKSIFITINPDNMRQRLIKRGDDQEEIDKRINQMIETKEHLMPDADFTIINDDFEKAKKALLDIVL